MPCTCNNTPCTCAPSATTCPPAPTTKCDLYVHGVKNVWVEHGDGPDDYKRSGICMLDTMTDPMIIYVLERDEQAREDLLKVTTNAHLLELARTVPRLPEVETMDAEQAMFNRPNDPDSIPFYTIFRGNPPFVR